MPTTLVIISNFRSAAIPSLAAEIFSKRSAGRIPRRGVAVRDKRVITRGRQEKFQLRNFSPYLRETE
jgi:hypothetical protein